MSENVMVLSTEKQMRRAQIEMRIEMHRDAATGSLLEVGRQLCAAKDEGVVPHGQWSAWVAQHAAMSERVAQKWMQAARELPPGSPLERLGIAKIQSLMMIESGEREEFAEKIGADKLSSREVDAAVKAARAERDEALRVVGEQKKRVQTAEVKLDEALRMLDDREKRLREKVEENCLHRQNLSAERSAIARLKRERSQQNLEIEKLREELRKARMSVKTGPDPETERKIALLESQIKSCDAAIAQRELEIDRLSDELDAAKTAAMRGGMTGGGDKPSPSTTILSSIGALMAQAGRAPGELARLQGIDAETREILCGQARLVGQWAMQILAACGEGEASV